MNDNGEEAASQIARSVAGELTEVLTSNGDILVTGLTSGGDASSVRPIRCMDGSLYTMKPNQRDSASDVARTSAEKQAFRSMMTESLVASIRATEVADVGDARVLISGMPDAATEMNARLILWSTFLSQGTDCLEQQVGEKPSYQLALTLATRCEELALLPQVPQADMTVLGAGSEASDDKALRGFGLSLAAELCNRMARSCDIRESLD